MGYTQYIYRPKELDKDKFKKLATDVQKIFKYCQNDLGIALAGGLGEGEPEVNNDVICFNGSEKQPKGIWTTPQQISIPWPSPSAGLTEPSVDPIDEKTEGTWFAGDLLAQRVAPLYDSNPEFADGSYETFLLERVHKPQKWEEPDNKGRYFSCCKTAYRPYDLAITAVLIAIKHHFPECNILGDGEEKDWLEARILCNNVLGYGFDEAIGEEREEA